MSSRRNHLSWACRLCSGSICSARSGNTRCLRHMFASASVATMMVALAADKPATNAAPLMKVEFSCRPIARPVYSAGRVCPSLIPAQAIGRMGRLNSIRYRGRPQAEAYMSLLSVFSAKVMWKICGMHTAPAKNISSKPRAVSPRMGLSSTLFMSGLCVSH